MGTWCPGRGAGGEGRSLAHASLSRRLEKTGRAAISLGLSQILDRQGMLPAEHFRLLRPLLACWTRCRALAVDLPGGGLGPRPEQRYQRFLRNALRCTRPDGRPLLADDNGGAWGRELWEAVLQGGTDDIDRNLAALALPKMSPGVAGKAPKNTADLPPASICWEEGSIAVMRRNWNHTDERIAAVFPRARAASNWLLPGGLPHPASGDSRLPSRASNSSRYRTGNRVAGIPTKTLTTWNWRLS